MSQTITGAKTFLAGSATTVPLTVQAAVGQTSNLSEWKDSSGNVIAAVHPTGRIMNNIAASATSYVFGNKDSAVGSDIFVTPGSATKKGITVQGVLGQSANLQEWQDSTGTALSYVRSTGDMFATYMNIGSLLFAGSTSRLSVQPQATTEKGFTIRGAVSQGANLFETQNSAGTPLNRIAASGQITAYNGIYSTTYNSVNGAGADQPAGVPLVVGGAPSQTGNLFEVRNSAGTLLSGFGSTGLLMLSAGAVGGTAVGSYWGHVIVSIPGIGDKKIQIFN